MDADSRLSNLSNGVGAMDGGGGLRVWEVPWSTDDMRNRSHAWTLAGDAGLLNKLQEMAQTLVSQTHHIQQEMNALAQETDSCNARLSNTFNDFLMLSNTQFVENRVYDDEVIDVTANDSNQSSSHAPAKRSKEEREAEIVARVSEALRLGMSVVDSAYEQLVVQDSDSEDDDDQGRPSVGAGHEPILHPKDRYANRPLPYIIGSRQFMEDDYVGLGNPFSEDEGSADEDNEDDDHSSLSSAAEEEEVPPSRPSADRSAHPTTSKKYDQDSTSEDLNYESKTYESKQQFEDSEESHSSDLFTAREAREDSPIVAAQKESTKEALTKDLSTRLRQQQRLKTSANQSVSSISSSGSDEDDDSLFKPKKKTTKKAKGRTISRESSPIETAAARRKSSIGAASVDQSVSAATKARSTSPVPEFGAPSGGSQHEDEDYDDDGLFGGGGLFAKRGRLFDDSEDLFGSTSDRTSAATATNKPAEKDHSSQPVTKKRTSYAGHDLFGGSGGGQDDEDDDDDLFASIASKTGGIKKALPAKSSIFDDDDNKNLFGENEVESAPPVDPFLKVSASATTKKKLAGAVSMFGGAVNPLSLGLGHHQQSKDDSADDSSSRTSVVSSPASVLSEAALTSSATTVTTATAASIGRPAPAPSSGPSSTGPSSPGSSRSFKATPGFLFADEADDDDLFATPSSTSGGGGGGSALWRTDNSGAGQSKKPALFAAPSLFGSGDQSHQDDDDDDIFAPRPKTLSPRTSALANPAVSGPTGSSPAGTSSSAPARRSKISLFDDDDDEDDVATIGGVGLDSDLFGASSTAPSSGQSLPSVGSKPAVISGRDTKTLFGHDAHPFDADPEVDLFGGGSFTNNSNVAKNMKEEVKSGLSAPLAVAPKSGGVVRGLFADDADEDLFAPSPASPIVSDKQTSRKVAAQQPTPSPVPVARRIQPPVALKKEPDDPAPPTAASSTTRTLSVTPPTTTTTSSDTSVSPRRKPPVGGVSMFGGILPPMLKPKHDREEREESDDVLSSVPDFAAGPKGHSAPMQSVSPTTSDQQLSATFDEPVEANVLSNANKDRIKIQVKRRPPTRRGRQEALRKSAIDLLPDHVDDNDGTIATQVSSSAPTSPSTDTPPVTAIIPTSRHSQRQKKVASIASPSTEEEDLFAVGDAAAVPPPNNSSSTAISGAALRGTLATSRHSSGDSSDDADGDDLFRPRRTPVAGSHSVPVKVSPKVSPRPTHRQLDSRDARTEIDCKAVQEEGKRGNKMAKLDDSDDSGGDELFAVVGRNRAKATDVAKGVSTKPSLLKSSGPRSSLFGDEDDDDDLFGSLTTTTASSSSAAKSSSNAAKPAQNTTKQTLTKAGVDNSDQQQQQQQQQAKSSGLFDDPLGLTGNK